MKKKITIALDCMGGDEAPRIVIQGAEIVALEKPDIHFLFYGDQALINPLLDEFPLLKERSTLFHTDQFISADEKPSNALRKGTKSSMRLAIDSAKEQNSDAVVSAGNTGALMAIAKIVLRPLPFVDRPAIVTFMPNQKSTGTVMLDMGANIECDAKVLYQFAIMGHAYAKVVLKITKPTIGLLNVGTEDLKGNEAVKGAASLLKESEFAEAFQGYVEGNDIGKGTVDVVVTDGFTGNIALKAIEGTAKLVSGVLKDGFSDSFFSKVGYLLASKSLKKVFKGIDPRYYNGAMLVGLNGIVVKSHGSADKVGFSNAIRTTISLVENQINEKIIEEIKSSGLCNSETNLTTDNDRQK